MAPSSMPTTTPDSSSVSTGILPFLVARPIVRNTAQMAPTKAKAGIANMFTAFTPRLMATTAPTVAPLETPMMPGSARGLLKIPCNIVPEAASPAPTIKPTRVRGERINISTASCWAETFTSCSTGSPSLWQHQAATCKKPRSY